MNNATFVCFVFVFVFFNTTNNDGNDHSSLFLKELVICLAKVVMSMYSRIIPKIIRMV